MERYSSYKATSMQWLKEIPSHWEERKISSIFRERREKVSDKDYAPLSVSKQGVTPQLETAVKTDNGDNRKLVFAGDFVVNSRSDRKGSCGVSLLDGSVSLINIVLKPSSDIYNMYFHYLARSNDYIEEFYRLGRGIVADLWTTRYSELKGIMIPLPPLVEQKKIVSYLESKTSKIDEYLDCQKQELDLYKELIESIIYSKNTKDFIVFTSWEDFFDSTWQTKLGKGLFDEVEIKGVSSERFLAVTQDKGLIYKDVDGVNFVTAEKKETQKLVCPGEFVISLRSFEGGIEYSTIKGLVSPAYVVLRLREEYNTIKYQMYFRFLFKSVPFVNRLNSVSDSMRDGKAIKFSDIKHFPFPIPSNKKLEEIYKLSEIYDVKKKAFEEKKLLLKQYKQRLIADVVTGQVNVQNEI